MPTKQRAWKEVDEAVRGFLGLGHSLIGVKLRRSEIKGESPFKPEKPMEYCKMLRLASTENRIFLYERDDEACITAQFTLGLRAPKHGGVKPRVDPADVKSILIAPLSQIDEDPDIIHAILNPRQMMDLAIILEAAGVEQLSVEFKGDKACSDFTAKPYMERKPNISFFCSGARLYADYRDSELVFGAHPEVFSKVAEAVVNLLKTGGTLCGCRTSDIPAEMTAEFERIGLAKGIDYFFGKIDGYNVRVYLNKNLQGRFHFLTVHLPVKMTSEEEARETVERLGVMTRPYRVNLRGNWIDLSMMANADELAIDLLSAEDIRRVMKSAVDNMLRYLERVVPRGVRKDEGHATV